MRLFNFLNRTLWAPYLRALDRYPLVSVLMGTGDVLAQGIEHVQVDNKKKTFKWDQQRTLTMTTVGMCFSGPVLHYWFKRLDTLVKGEAFIGLMGTINGKTPRDEFRIDST
eukprot:gene12200-14278_t